jgi:hypothetical protein
MTLEIPSQEGNTFARNGDHKAMHTAFALVRSLGHAASQSVKAVRHAVAVERYVLEAARAGHCRATALRYLEDELLDRASRGLCGDVRCAAGRARVRMAEADRLGSTAIPGQRTVMGELAPAAEPARDWFEDGTPSPVEQCPGCGNPTAAGMGCETCSGRAWHPSQQHDTDTCGCPTCTEWRTAAMESVMQQVAELPDFPDDPAAVADAWVLDQFGPDTLEALPNLMCSHLNESRWQLADGTRAVRCTDCGQHAIGDVPGKDPALPRHWVFADGEVVDDV